jgi:esterase
MAGRLSTQKVTVDGATPEGWVAVLHGIFGSGRNWGQVARGLVRARPEWGALLVDLRQHGGSQGFPPPHTMERTAADLGQLDAGGPIQAIMGHSFGGKIALLRGRVDRGVRQVWVIDSTPDAAEPGGGPWAVLAMLRRMPPRFDDRDAAIRTLTERGLARPLATWMATNLEATTDGYTWRLDFDDMEALLQDFFDRDLWALVEEPRPGLDIHFIRATGSAVLTAHAVRRIREAGVRTGQVFLHEVPGGHWLNADNPSAIVELMARTL